MVYALLKKSEWRSWIMARSKFNFEKRQKEKARQQKQLEKAARKKEVRQRKDEVDTESPGEGTDITGIETDTQPHEEGEQQ
jgi:hypothetical protein